MLLSPGLFALPGDAVSGPVKLFSFGGSHVQADLKECRVALALSWCKPDATVSTCSWPAASETSEETGHSYGRPYRLQVCN